MNVYPWILDQETPLNRWTRLVRCSCPGLTPEQESAVATECLRTEIAGNPCGTWHAASVVIGSPCSCYNCASVRS